MHQDIEGSLATSSIAHAGGPQSPARSAENLLNGHRPKGLMELGRREESTTDAGGPTLLVRALRGSRWAGVRSLSNRLSLGRLFRRVKLAPGSRQGPRPFHLHRHQAENLLVQV